MYGGEEVRRIQQYSFRMDNLLGKGATGEVYLGENTNNGDKVACKIIDMSKIDNEVTEYLLHNEKKALELLHHPNVIHTVDIFQEKDFCYIFTEFCNEGTLFDRIQSKGRLSEEEALGLFAQIVEGYRACAQKGIIHRDLKPANILMNEGVPLISDFGYCEIVGIPKPKIFYNVGSPSYMAPEAFVVNIYSEKSDVWSLGVVLYEMIVGHTFDGGGDIMECISNLGKHGVPYPEHASPYCRYVINQCLNLDPARRISLKQLIQIIRDRAALENSDALKMGAIHSHEQPTAAQIPQLQRSMPQPQQIPHQRIVQNKPARHPIQQQMLAQQPHQLSQPTHPTSQHAPLSNPMNAYQPQRSSAPQSPLQLFNSGLDDPSRHNHLFQQTVPQMQNRVVRIPQQPGQQERVHERAVTHHIPSEVRAEHQGGNSQEYLHLYEQTLYQQTQGRENIVLPRLMSHHAVLQDYHCATTRSLKPQPSIVQQRVERIESEMLRKVPSLEATHFRGRSEYVPQMVHSSRGLPHKSDRELVIPTHERMIPHQQATFRPFSIQEGMVRPATTASMLGPYSEQTRDHKLVRSLLMTDVNKQEGPHFTQMPFQKPQLFDHNSQIPKPQTQYLPGYNPFSHRLPEQTHARTLLTQSPISPIYTVAGQQEAPLNRQPPMPHIPSFKKPIGKYPDSGIPQERAGTEPAYPYQNVVHCPENRQNPAMRGPSMHRNGIPSQRIIRHAGQDQRGTVQPSNAQYRPVR